MTKFKITETQIDNYNETHNQFQNFEDGLNIICGPNEIGKSTLMDFIKNIFIKKSSSAKGYIKCEHKGKSFKLVSGNSKDLKENEEFISKINPHDYQTGFVITIDDLMFAKKSNAEELLNTIKDSSGNAVNKKQEEYYNYIYDNKKQDFSLTSKNGASSYFKKQFEKLNRLENKIKELQLKEEEYNTLCQNIENIEHELKNQTQKQECGTIILQKKSLIEESQNIKINTTLLENKTEFDSLREEFGALNSLKNNESTYNEKIKNSEKDFEEKFSKLNRLQPLSKEEFQELILTNDDYKYGRNIIEETNKLLYEKKNINSKIKELNSQIEEIQTKINSIEHARNDLKINDIKEFKSDKTLLEEYLAQYSDIQNKLLSQDTTDTKEYKWYSMMFMQLFIASGILSLGALIYYWHYSVKYVLISIILTAFVGLNTLYMQNLSKKRYKQEHGYAGELNNCHINITKLCKKYGYTFSCDDNPIVSVRTFIKDMENKINDYERIETDSLNTRISLERNKSELENQENLEEELSEKENIINENSRKFLEKTKLNSLDNFDDIFELYQSMKAIQNVIKTENENIKIIDNKTETFVLGLNRFIEHCKLDEFRNYNKYDYMDFNKVISQLDKLICENIAQEKLLSDINIKIEKSEKELSNYPQEILNELENIDENMFNEIKEFAKETLEEKAKLTQKKLDMEQVSGLLNLKNEKNIELNRINRELLKLFQKELVYNAIKNAKEKFNETQPNFLKAKDYFSDITDGKYTEIDFENKTISGKNIGDKDWDNLSRGTKEQLYLALRFGYAENYTKDIEGNPNGFPNMPLIIDDAFVNFDNKRTAAILKCLDKFSKTNQVLFFTCHTDNIKELLKKLKIKYNYIELN